MLCMMWPTLGVELSVVVSGEGSRQKIVPQKPPKRAKTGQNSHFVAKEKRQHVWFIDTKRESGRVKRMAKVERNPSRSFPEKLKTNPQMFRC